MSDVIGSAEFEIKANTKRLKDDLRRTQGEVKREVRKIEQEVQSGAAAMQRAFANSGQSEFEKSMRVIRNAANHTEKEVTAAADNIAGNLRGRFREVGTDVGRSLANVSRVAQIAFGAVVAYSIKAASEAEDIGDAFEFTFSKMQPQAEQTAAAIADSFKRTSTQVKGNLTTMYQVLTGLGLDSQTAFAASSQLTSRALDLASQKGISDARAFQAVLGGITGETEPLKNLGVVLSEAAVKSELARMGLKGSAEGATEAQKAAARLNLILAKTSTAQGDVARTSDSAANKAKELQTEFQNTAVELGTQLLPSFVKVAGAATDTLRAFNNLPQGVQVASLAFLGFIAAGGPIAGMLANLAKLIKLAGEARVAIALAAGGNAVAGSVGAGAAGAGATALGVAGAPVTVAVAGATAWTIATQKAKAYEGVLKDIKKATDADLAAAKAYAEANIRSFDRSPSRVQTAIDRRSGFSAATYSILAEQQRREREARAAGGTAGVDSSVVGGFGLPPGGTTAAGKASHGPTPAELAARREDLRLVNELAVAEAAGNKAAIAALKDEIAYRALIEQFRNTGLGQAEAQADADWQLLMLARAREEAEANIIKARKVDANPDGFESSADRVAAATQALDESRAAGKEAFRDMFTGGLMAALRGGSRGFTDWIAQNAERGLEKALDNLADLIFELFSQAGSAGGIGGGGGGVLDTVLSTIGKVFGGARAYGGPVTAGTAYRVGEKGPETLIAPANGMIIPNGGFAGSSSRPAGGGQVLVRIQSDDPKFRAFVASVAGPIAAAGDTEVLGTLAEHQKRRDTAAKYKARKG